MKKSENLRSATVVGHTTIGLVCTNVENGDQVFQILVHILDSSGVILGLEVFHDPNGERSEIRTSVIWLSSSRIQADWQTHKVSGKIFGTAARGSR